MLFSDDGNRKCNRKQKKTEKIGLKENRKDVRNKKKRNNSWCKKKQ